MNNEADHDLLVRLNTNVEIIITQMATFCQTLEGQRNDITAHTVAIARLQDRVSTSQAIFGVLEAGILGMLAFLGLRKP